MSTNGTKSNGNGIVSNLRQLLAIISENVDAIERLAEQEGVTYPTIDTLYDPDSKSEKFTLKPDVINVAMLATSAASQLAATLRLPGVTLLERAHGVRRILVLYNNDPSNIKPTVSYVLRTTHCIRIMRCRVVARGWS